MELYKTLAANVHLLNISFKSFYITFLFFVVKETPPLPHLLCITF